MKQSTINLAALRPKPAAPEFGAITNGDQAIAALDKLKLCFPFEVQTKHGPALLAKADVSDEFAAKILPHEQAIRARWYTLKRDEETGRWTVCQWVKLNTLP